MIDLESLRRDLGSVIGGHASSPGRTESAVLVIIHDPAAPSVVMTVKPRSMREHAGEVAFPGGKREDGDADLLDTALREAREELGLEVRRGEVAGQLRTVETQISGYAITPFVCVRGSLGALEPNSEVDEILRMPLEQLLRTRDPAGKLGLEFTHGAHTVWGASARILEEICGRTGLA